MARELSPQRRKVVVLASSIASMSACSMLFRNHPYVQGAWMVGLAALTVYVISEMIKLRRSEGCSGE